MASTTKSKSSTSTASKKKSSSSKSSSKQRTWPVPPNTTSPPNEKVDGKDVTKLDQGLDDLSLEQLDGAYAVLRLGKETRLVGQADLISAQKKLSKAVQQTY